MYIPKRKYHESNEDYQLRVDISLEHQRACRLRWKEAHPDKVKASQKAWREAHRDLARARVKAWRDGQKIKKAQGEGQL